MWTTTCCRQTARLPMITGFSRPLPRGTGSISAGLATGFSQVHMERFGVPGKNAFGADSHTPGLPAFPRSELRWPDAALAMDGIPIFTLPKCSVRLIGKLPDWECRQPQGYDYRRPKAFCPGRRSAPYEPGENPLPGLLKWIPYLAAAVWRNL